MIHVNRTISIRKENIHVTAKIQILFVIIISKLELLDEL